MRVHPVGYRQAGAGQTVKSLMENPAMLLIDIRYSPGSMSREWCKSALEDLYGARYRWAGKYLGNELYQQRGSIKLADPVTGIIGLRKYLAKGHDLILLCRCEDYQCCHRKSVVDLLLHDEPTVRVVQPVASAAVGTMPAISLIQPYATIVSSPDLLEAVGVPAKRIENRDWRRSYRGPLLLHASKRFDTNALPFWSKRFPELLDAMPLERSHYVSGGIVGIADLVDVVVESEDPWFCGKYGLILANARPLPFIACPGQPAMFSVPLDLVQEALERVSR